MAGAGGTVIRERPWAGPEPALTLPNRRGLSEVVHVTPELRAYLEKIRCPARLSRA